MWNDCPICNKELLFDPYKIVFECQDTPPHYLVSFIDKKTIGFDLYLIDIYMFGRYKNYSVIWNEDRLKHSTIRNYTFSFDKFNSKNKIEKLLLLI